METNTFASALQTKEFIIQLSEELRESQDTVTRKLIEKCDKNDRSNSIDFFEFKRRYSI